MSHMIGLTKATLLTYILPPVVCLYSMGVLVQLEGTRTYRMALLPVTACLAWRATFVDMSGGDPTMAQINVTLITQMCIVTIRSAVWAFARVRYRRHNPMVNGKEPTSGSVYTACWNTWELLINARGIGWNWSPGLAIREPAFKTDSRLVFVLSTAAGFVFNAVALDACVQTICVMSPETFGSMKGGTLFDHTLPLTLELSRAVLVSFLTAAVAYFLPQHAYQLLSIVCVVVFQQHPSQWPPLFDAPLLSTSLSQLWGRRWHQLMRDSVLNLGYRPFHFVLGRSGGLLGAFLVSGIFHSLDLAQPGYTRVCLTFYIMNAVGIILERLWARVTGRTVRGVWGWMWTAGWLFLWGIPMANAYAESGRLGALHMTGGFEPSLALVGIVRNVFKF